MTKPKPADLLKLSARGTSYYKLRQELEEKFLVPLLISGDPKKVAEATEFINATTIQFPSPTMTNIHRTYTAKPFLHLLNEKS